MSSRRLILIFGEDSNDRAALKHLIKAMLPSSFEIAINPIRRPIILNRDATRSGKRKKMADEIAAFAQSFQKLGKAVFVVAHQDCDAIEPAHLAAADGLESDLRTAGVEQPIAATPAWEIETWWMLFPDAVASVRKCWRRIDYGEKNVGMITNSKEKLIRDLRPTGSNAKIKCPDYCESDSIKVAEHILNNRELLSDIKAKCESFVFFRGKIVKTIK